MANIELLENKLQGLHLADPAGYDRVYHDKFTDTKQTGISATEMA
jgi:hypothetical protein